MARPLVRLAEYMGLPIAHEPLYTYRPWTINVANSSLYCLPVEI